MVKDDQGVAAYVSPEGQEVINSERNNRKDSARAGERQHGSHPNKSHHGIKGRQAASSETGKKRRCTQQSLAALSARAFPSKLKY